MREANKKKGREGEIIQAVLSVAQQGWEQVASGPLPDPLASAPAAVLGRNLSSISSLFFADGWPCHAKGVLTLPSPWTAFALTAAPFYNSLVLSIPALSGLYQLLSVL